MGGVDGIEKFVDDVTKKVDGEFHQAMLVTSQGDREDFQKTVKYLEERFGQVKAERDYQSRTLGVDSNGFYQPATAARTEAGTDMQSVMLGRAIASEFGEIVLKDKINQIT